MLKIGTKLGLGIGTLLALCVLIGLVSYMQTRVVREKLEEVTQVKEPLNSAVYGLENNLVETAFAALGYSATGDRKLYEAYQQSKKEFDENRSRSIGVVDVTNGSGTGAELQGGFARFHSIASEQIDLRDLQTRHMQTLLKDLDAIDRLLKDRIQASVKADDPLAYRRLQATLEMQVQVNAITKGLGNFLLTGESQFESRILAARQEFEHFFQVYQVVTLSTEEKAWAAELRRRSAETLELAGTIIDLEKQRTRQFAAFMSQYRELGSLLNDRLQKQTEKSLADAKEDVLQAGQAANTTILAVLFISLAFGIGAGVATTRNITRPLRHLASVMNAIARGERVQPVELRSSDELRSVGDAFNHMTGQLVRANEELRTEFAEQKRLQLQLDEAERQRLISLRRFAISVQRAQEEERARISRELHDDICQRLTGMKFRVEVLEEAVLPMDRRVSRQLREVKQELDRSITEVQKISSNLRPSVLDDFGLVTALRLLCKGFEKMHHIRTVVTVEADVPAHVDGDVEIALYRIAQEALSNIGRHAGASTVTLHLRSQGSLLMLTIEDDGKGFTPEDTMRSKEAGHGLGLISMRERSELLGGSFEVAAVANKGTTVSVTIPVGAQ